MLTVSSTMRSQRGRGTSRRRLGRLWSGSGRGRRGGRSGGDGEEVEGLLGSKLRWMCFDMRFAFACIGAGIPTGFYKHGVCRWGDGDPGFRIVAVGRYP